MPSIHRVRHTPAFDGQGQYGQVAPVSVIQMSLVRTLVDDDIGGRNVSQKES